MIDLTRLEQVANILREMKRDLDKPNTKLDLAEIYIREYVQEKSPPKVRRRNKGSEKATDL